MSTVQERKLISSGSKFEPILGFSRAVRVGNVVAISGTAPVKDGKTAAPGDAAGQAKRCLEIIAETLLTAGVSLADVVRTRVMLTRIEDWEAVGQVHGSVFGEIRPACTFVQVSRLIDPEWLVEIEADAVIPNHI
jgi:enamine deaminase RidA (YjgF/YER057c/UK114 family)